jgi:hypothetical protein
MPRTRYRWFIVFLLFVITVVNCIGRGLDGRQRGLLRRQRRYRPSAGSDGVMTGLALSSVLAVLLFHRPDRDRESPPGAIA